jgi:hypothetical protein
LADPLDPLVVTPEVIRSLALVAAVVSLAVATPHAQSFTRLFDGTLTGWSIHGTEADNFSVRDGALRVEGPTGWIRFDRQQYADFVLRLQLRFLTADADSGIFFRTDGASMFGRGWPLGGYQVQVRVPTTPSPLPPLGGLFRHGTPPGETTLDEALLRKVFKGLGEWHDVEVEAAGDRLTVRIEGAGVTRASGIRTAPGYIGFQGETGAIEYRAIEIAAR